MKAKVKKKCGGSKSRQCCLGTANFFITLNNLDVIGFMERDGVEVISNTKKS